MTTIAPVCPESTINRRQQREKRVHHHAPHLRPIQRPADNRQRKPRAAKQRPTNIISTDGTTSGEDGSETKNSEQDVSNKLENLLRRSDNRLASDLEADCEDNTGTDVDQVSLSGSLPNKNESSVSDNSAPQSETVHLLNSKISALEKQLATVLQLNLKLKEENDQLKKMIVTK